jgi:transposase
VRIVDRHGGIVRETKIASEPDVPVAFVGSSGFAVTRIGLSAGPLVAMAACVLARAGKDVVLLGTRHVKTALSAMIVKKDWRDAHGIVQLLRVGRYRAVHAKSLPAQEVREPLVARKQLQAKMRGYRAEPAWFRSEGGEVSKATVRGAIGDLVSATRCWNGSRRRCFRQGRH